MNCPHLMKYIAINTFKHGLIGNHPGTMLSPTIRKTAGFCLIRFENKTKIRIEQVGYFMLCFFFGENMRYLFPVVDFLDTIDWLISFAFILFCTYRKKFSIVENADTSWQLSSPKSAPILFNFQKGFLWPSRKPSSTWSAYCIKTPVNPFLFWI